MTLLAKYLGFAALLAVVAPLALYAGQKSAHAEGSEAFPVAPKADITLQPVVIVGELHPAVSK